MQGFERVHAFADRFVGARNNYELNDYECIDTEKGEHTSVSERESSFTQHFRHEQLANT